MYEARWYDGNKIDMHDLHQFPWSRTHTPSRVCPRRWNAAVHRTGRRLRVPPRRKLRVEKLVRKNTNSYNELLLPELNQYVQYVPTACSSPTPLPTSSLGVHQSLKTCRFSKCFCCPIPDSMRRSNLQKTTYCETGAWLLPSKEI